jgi:hypothetical protein
MIFFEKIFSFGIVPRKKMPGGTNLAKYKRDVGQANAVDAESYGHEILIV